MQLSSSEGSEMKRVSSDAEKPTKPRRTKKQRSAPKRPLQSEREEISEAQRSGFDIVGASIARPQNEAESSFPGSYGNREKVTKRVSSSAGSHAAAAPAKRTKRKGGAHCAK